MVAVATSREVVVLAAATVDGVTGVAVLLVKDTGAGVLATVIDDVGYWARCRHCRFCATLKLEVVAIGTGNMAS